MFQIKIEANIRLIKINKQEIVTTLHYCGYGFPLPCICAQACTHIYIVTGLIMVSNLS